ncbi:MAG: PD-(D/E)XK nuclease family protein [Planctomycetota bacterium]
MPNSRPARWTTSPPAAWPTAPVDLTVSALGEIEACPRRWALNAASYPDLWASRGYPPRVRSRSLAGSLVHTVLETVTRELVQAGCPTVQDASAIGVLQALGGFSKIIAASITQMIERLALNPRTAPHIDQIARTLRAQTGELRVRVQMMLSRRQLPPSQGPRAPGSSTLRARTALAVGAYCELELRAPSIHWKGKADLLTLTPSLCELTDFKTGERSENHDFQLVTYALLWSLDSELNPSKRLVDRLVLVYSDGDVATPAPTGQVLDEFERQLVERSERARLSLTQLPPPARPGTETCRYCGVRQLCDEYWQSADMLIVDSEKRFGDVEATLSKRHGPTSWDIVIESVASRPNGLLRTAVGVVFKPGDRVRLLDAALKLPDAESGEPIVITLGALSEVFSVED